MKIRHGVLFVAAGVLALLLASCFLQTGGSSGSLSFSLSRSTNAKSIATAGEFRVYLAGTDGKLMAIGGAGDADHPLYHEAAFTSGAVYASPPIPAGGPYSVIVVLGSGTGSSFIPSDYGTAAVTIAPGVSSAVTITSTASPITLRDAGLWGTNVNGLVVAAGNVFTSTSSKLYSVGVAPGSLAATALANQPTADYTINSLSLGAEGAGYTATPWLNTNKGILPYSQTAPGYDITFAAAPSKVNVIQSAYLNSGSTFHAAMYQREAGLGGTVLTSGAPGTWVDVDLSEFLSGTPFLDSLRGPDGSFAYFATSLGAFRLGSSVIGDNTTTTAKGVLDKAVFFDVTVNQKKLPILSLAIVQVQGSNFIYMGTSNGVYVAPLTEDSSTVAIGTATLVAGTDGSTVTRIKGISAGPTALLAFLADNAVYFWDGSNLSTLPFYSGLPADLPGQLNTLELYNDNTNVFLLVVGKKGLVAYKVR